MTRIRIPRVFAVAPVVLVLVVLALTRPAIAVVRPPAAPTLATSVGSRYSGVPAIQASLLGHIPAFTEGDVRSYIHAHHFPGTSQVIDDSKITSVQFIPSAEAVKLMKGEETGIGDSELVCYVEFANINVTLDEVPIPPVASPPVIHSGQIVYDASNGNLLVWGGL